MWITAFRRIARRINEKGSPKASFFYRLTFLILFQRIVKPLI